MLGFNNSVSLIIISELVFTSGDQVGEQKKTDYHMKGAVLYHISGKEPEIYLMFPLLFSHFNFAYQVQCTRASSDH